MTFVSESLPPKGSTTLRRGDKLIFGPYEQSCAVEVHAWDDSVGEPPGEVSEERGPTGIPLLCPLHHRSNIELARPSSKYFQYLLSTCLTLHRCCYGHRPPLVRTAPSSPRISVLDRGGKHHPRQPPDRPDAAGPRRSLQDRATGLRLSDGEGRTGNRLRIQWVSLKLDHCAVRIRRGAWQVDSPPADTVVRTGPRRRARADPSTPRGDIPHAGGAAVQGG